MLKTTGQQQQPASPDYCTEHIPEVVSGCTAEPVDPLEPQDQNGIQALVDEFSREAKRRNLRLKET